MTVPQPPEADDRHRERLVLGMIAVCCAAPMLVIALLVGVLGVAIGPAAAISLGLVAAGVCVAAMVARHRGQREGPRDR